MKWWFMRPTQKKIKYLPTCTYPNSSDRVGPYETNIFNHGPVWTLDSDKAGALIYAYVFSRDKALDFFLSSQLGPLKFQI